MNGIASSPVQPFPVNAGAHSPSTSSGATFVINPSHNILPRSMLPISGMCIILHIIIIIVIHVAIIIIIINLYMALSFFCSLFYNNNNNVINNDIIYHFGEALM